MNAPLIKASVLPWWYQSPTTCLGQFNVQPISWWGQPSQATLYRTKSDWNLTSVWYQPLQTRLIQPHLHGNHKVKECGIRLKFWIQVVDKTPDSPSPLPSVLSGRVLFLFLQNLGEFPYSISWRNVKYYKLFLYFVTCLTQLSSWSDSVGPSQTSTTDGLWIIRQVVLVL